jgi:hypothetical protein
MIQHKYLYSRADKRSIPKGIVPRPLDQRIDGPRRRAAKVAVRGMRCISNLFQCRLRSKTKRIAHRKSGCYRDPQKQPNAGSIDEGDRISLKDVKVNVAFRVRKLFWAEF